MDTQTKLRIIEAFIEQEKGVTVRINEPKTMRQQSLMERAYAKANLMLKK